MWRQPVVFVNHSAVTVRLDWSDFTCRRRTYAVLRPGEQAAITSYVTHSWVFVEDSTGYSLGARVIAAGDRYISIP